MNIILHIERLVLEGIEVLPHQRPLLQAAIETELFRLLTAHGLAAGLQTGAALPVVQGGNIRLTNNAAPTPLGQQIAQAIYSSLGSGEAGSESKSIR